MTDKRSPLKDRPLRNPGQSLEEPDPRYYVNDYMLWPMLCLAIIFRPAAALEWFRYFDPSLRRREFIVRCRRCARLRRLSYFQRPATLARAQARQGRRESRRTVSRKSTRAGLSSLSRCRRWQFQS